MVTDGQIIQIQSNALAKIGHIIESNLLDFTESLKIVESIIGIYQTYIIQLEKCYEIN